MCYIFIALHRYAHWDGNHIESPNILNIHDLNNSHWQSFSFHSDFSITYFTYSLLWIFSISASNCSEQHSYISISTGIRISATNNAQRYALTKNIYLYIGIDKVWNVHAFNTFSVSFVLSLLWCTEKMKRYAIICSFNFTTIIPIPCDNIYITVCHWLWH